MREADSAAQARTLLAQELPDLALLDIMMPGEDGLSLCRHLVESRGLPTILLTAKGEAMDRIIGLEIGADDYVTKPVSPAELLARVRALLRRANPAPNDETLRCGDICIILPFGNRHQGNIGRIASGLLRSRAELCEQVRAACRDIRRRIHDAAI